MTITEEKKPLTAAQKKKRRVRHKAWLRAAVQLLFFIAMPGAFVAGFSGVKYLFQWIGAGEVLQLNSFVKSLLGLLLFTILFGRFFCGYVCAFGSFGDGLYWLSGLIQKKLLHRKKQFQLPKKFLLWGQKLKYVILAVVVLLCTLGIYSSFSGTSPWDVFSQLTAGRLPAAEYGIGTVILLLILVGMALQERFFCQFLCPMGAVFALLPVLPVSMLRRREGDCIRGCNACAMQCPVSLKLQDDGVRNGECIACEKCTAACPKGNISRPEQQWIKQELLLVLGKTILFFAMGSFLGF